MSMGEPKKLHPFHCNNFVRSYTLNNFRNFGTCMYYYYYYYYYYTLQEICNWMI